MGRPLKYRPRKNARPAGSRTHGRNGVSLPSRRKLPKCRRLRATFVDESDGRYASVNGIIYPVLLTSCLTGLGYKEDMRDSVDYPTDWCRRFVYDVNCRAAAILVCDADEDSWKFLGLFHVDNIQMSSFLTCRIRAKLAELRLLPGA